jgi:hypothetical protein
VRNFVSQMSAKTGTGYIGAYRGYVASVSIIESYITDHLIGSLPFVADRYRSAITNGHVMGYGMD